MSEPSTDRLVIRIKLVTEEEPAPPPPPAPRLNKGVTLAIAGVAAVLIGWFSIGSLRSDPPPPPVARASAPIAATAPSPMPAKSIEAEVPDAPLAAVNEVIPDVPKSALGTIRGTVKVVIRVTLDKQGAVVAATTIDRGPSRYFERLSREAAKKWTFTPATSVDQRTAKVQFNFTREGATAHLSDP